MKVVNAFAVISIALLGIAVEVSGEERHSLNIMFIGDSITSGYLMKSPERDAPPVYAVAWLKEQPSISRVLFKNCGKPGYRTDQFLPNRPNSAWDEVKQAGNLFQKEPGALLFSVMLGANDSAGQNDTAIHSPDRFRQDMKTLVQALCEHFPTALVVIHHPTGYTKAPGTYPENFALYLPEIDSVVKEMAKSYPGRVHLGDVKGWDCFQKNHQSLCFKESRENVPYYVHPNERGAKVFGQFWGEAIYNAIHNN